MKLLDLKKHNTKIIFDIRYATANNFVGYPVYDTPACYVHEEVALALDAVVADLEKQNLSLKVYDGYRIPSAIRTFWEKIQDERYVGNPDKAPGRHSKGTAVDVTLVNPKGEELEMPTPFDDFTEKAHADAENISEEAKKNRTLLTETMHAHGFVQMATEWWHFDLAGWDNHEKYPPLTLSFQEVEDALNRLNPSSALS